MNLCKLNELCCCPFRTRNGKLRCGKKISACHYIAICVFLSPALSRHVCFWVRPVFLVTICTALPTKNQEKEMKNEQTNDYFFLPVLYSWEKP